MEKTASSSSTSSMSLADGIAGGWVGGAVLVVGL